jgi:hypothetical protein
MNLVESWFKVLALVANACLPSLAGSIYCDLKLLPGEVFIICCGPILAANPGFQARGEPSVS